MLPWPCPVYSQSSEVASRQKQWKRGWDQCRPGGWTMSRMAARFPWLIRFTGTVTGPQQHCISTVAVNVLLSSLGTSTLLSTDHVFRFLPSILCFYSQSRFFLFLISNFCVLLFSLPPSACVWDCLLFASNNQTPLTVLHAVWLRGVIRVPHCLLRNPLDLYRNGVD